MTDKKTKDEKAAEQAANDRAALIEKRDAELKKLADNLEKLAAALELMISQDPEAIGLGEPDRISSLRKAQGYISAAVTKLRETIEAG